MNRDRVVKIARFAGCKNFVGKRKKEKDIFEIIFVVMWRFLHVKVLNEKAKHITGVQQWPYRAVSRALEVIPRTLIQNCGGQAIRTLTALRVRHTFCCFVASREVIC